MAILLQEKDKNRQIFRTHKKTSERYHIERTNGMIIARGLVITVNLNSICCIRSKVDYWYGIASEASETSAHGERTTARSPGRKRRADAITTIAVDDSGRRDAAAAVRGEQSARAADGTRKGRVPVPTTWTPPRLYSPTVVAAAVTGRASADAYRGDSGCVTAESAFNIASHRCTT